MNQEQQRMDRLQPLSALPDYKVAKDNPDVVGWRVLGADGESLGIVKDLIVDLKAMKARYLSVVADRRFFRTDRDQYLLVPIGAAALDKKGRKVFLSTLDANSIQRYPVYPGGSIPPDYELAVRDAFHQKQRDALPDTQYAPPAGTAYVPDDFYNSDTYNEDRFYASNQEVHRDKQFPSQAYNPADVPDESRKPQSVEESIATIERLEGLRERGALTEDEFKVLKKRALDL